MITPLYKVAPHLHQAQGVIHLSVVYEFVGLHIIYLGWFLILWRWLNLREPCILLSFSLWMWFLSGLVFRGVLLNWLLLVCALHPPLCPLMISDSVVISVSDLGTVSKFFGDIQNQWEAGARVWCVGMWRYFSTLSWWAVIIDFLMCYIWCCAMNISTFNVHVVLITHQSCSDHVESKTIVCTEGFILQHIPYD